MELEEERGRQQHITDPATHNYLLSDSDSEYVRERSTHSASLDGSDLLVNTNLRNFGGGDSLASLDLQSHSIYESGGEDPGVFVRWEGKNLEVKKFVDDVSGCEKIHMNNIYTSKYYGEKGTRYVHAVQGQALFDQVALKAKDRGMKLNPDKTNLLCCLLYTSPSPRDS